MAERAARRRKPSKPYAQVKAEINAKNPTEVGITGGAIPKKNRSPKKQHEFEKKRRANLGTNVGGERYSGASYSHHSMSRSTSGYNPRTRTFEEFMMCVSEATGTTDTP